MKKLKNKILRKNDNNVDSSTHQRITNETVAEHREKIIKEGRRFKYPHQYVKHRLIINTIIICILALIVTVIAGYWQLYKAQSSSDLMYRVTTVVPVSVASVDGISVKYSDYLLRFRSQKHAFERSKNIESNNDDRERQLLFLQRESLDSLERDMYAKRFAEERGIVVDSGAVQKVIDADLEQYGGLLTREAYDTIYERDLGLSRSEYEHLVSQAILRQEVAFAVDTKASDLSRKISRDIANGETLEAIRKKYGSDVVYAKPDEVRLTNLDGGLTQRAAKLKRGEISRVFRSTAGDSYYAVRLLAKTDTHLQYEYVQIKLTRFDELFETMKRNGGVDEFISIPETKVEVRK